MDKEYKDLCGEYFHEIWPAIDQENRNQLQEWGVQSHTLSKWLLITTEEYGEIAKAILEFEHGDGDKQKIIDECVQTITLLSKMVEMLDNE